MNFYRGGVCRCAVFVIFASFCLNRFVSAGSCLSEPEEDFLQKAAKEQRPFLLRENPLCYLRFLLLVYPQKLQVPRIMPAHK
jgi:hypothetical protein